MRAVLLGLSLIVAFCSGLLIGAESRWRSGTARLVRQLAPVPGDAAATPTDTSSFATLPQPVAAYFRAVLPASAPAIRHATITQRGVFRLRAGDDGWRPFTATQQIATAPAGFVWDATIRMLPGLSVRVRDSYTSEGGALRASLLGVYPLASVAGTAEIAQGALLRYLAEAVWAPTALLPSSGVQWAAIDDSSARATLTSGSTTVSLTFFFGPDHLVRRIYAPDRMREVKGDGVPTPWEGRFSEYAERNGMRIPLGGEVGWILPEGYEAYWRGHIESVTYE